MESKVRFVSIDALPGNFDVFVDEVAAGIDALYGPEAAGQYRSVARGNLAQALEQASMHAFAAMDGERAAALLFATQRRGLFHIHFMHRLGAFAGSDLDGELLAYAVEAFRAFDPNAIISECVTFYDGDLAEAYCGLGFARTPRALLAASTDAVANHGAPASWRLEPACHADAARIIADAYAGHPGRAFLFDVQDESSALDFVEQAAAGGYGEPRAEYLRIVKSGGVAAGIVVGCSISRTCGFVLQVCVRPEYQHRGLGTSLLRDLARIFRRDGMERIALGATLGSPELRLYERLGFAPIHAVDAYAWWKDTRCFPDSM